MKTRKGGCLPKTFACTTREEEQGSEKVAFLLFSL